MTRTRQSGRRTAHGNLLVMPSSDSPYAVLSEPAAVDASAVDATGVLKGRDDPFWGDLEMQEAQRAHVIGHAQRVAVAGTAVVAGLAAVIGLAIAVAT
jgi:hypothetical protein